jgi:nitrate reductase assembly molybdenum cofactor insertion protein NarJ
MELLREAAEWRLLSLFFEYPNTAWRDQVSALAADIEDARLKETAQAALAEAYEGMYHSLFGPGGPVPPREVTYLGGVQFGYLLAELAAYYEAFGYRPGTDESDDHIATETGFVAYLKLKEAYAQSSGNPDVAALTAESCRSFIEDHLSMVAQPVAEALEPIGPSYLVAASRLLAGLVGAPRRTPAVLDIDEEMNCSPDTLIQVQPQAAS